MLALGAILGHELNVDVQQRYHDTQLSSATLITQVGIQPLLTADQVSNGFTPAEIVALDEKLQGAALSKEVRRLKVWNRSGTVVYSDRPAIIGRTFPLDDDLGEALAGEANANITDGKDDENAGDNLVGPLLQVYVPLTFKGNSKPSGALELYLPYAPIQAAIDRESNQLYLMLAVGLTVFYAAMFPIVFIANRWRRRAESTALANLAVLERLNRLKSEFLIRMSHQFRTSLVGIEGFSELIKDSETLDLDEVKSFASDIYSDASRLDQAFNEMVELDQMEAGRTVLKFERTSVNTVVSDVVDASRHSGGDHQLVTNLEADVPPVSCDRERIAHTLSILIGNAAKYSRAGTEIVVSTAVEGDAVRVTVKDHGPGMPADFDRRLFVGHSNGSNGTGLGLAIARQIVEMHRGRIWFDSASGQGTEFHFTLPLKVRQTQEIKAVART